MDVESFHIDLMDTGGDNGWFGMDLVGCTELLCSSRRRLRLMIPGVTRLRLGEMTVVSAQDA